MEFSDVLTARHSTRRFSDEKVSGEQIRTMLEAAIAAPNACNFQSWHFYVVTDTLVKQSLAQQKVMAAWASTAPVIFVVCTDAEKLTARFGERAQNLFAVQDTALAAGNILMCAANMGLGGCFMGAFNDKLCSEILNIPQNRCPVAMIPVGKPADVIPARGRNPLEYAVTFVGDADGAEFTGKDTDFRHFELRNSKLPNALFDNLDLKESKFHNINMPQTIFDDINMKNSFFTNISLSETAFSDINLKNSTFGGMTFEGSKFSCVDMKNTTFENVDFGNATFRNCNMTDIKTEQTKNNPK